MAERLVELWSRPIFTLNDDYKTLAQVDAHRVDRGQAAPSAAAAARQALAAERAREVQERVDAARLHPNTRAQLPYAGEAELGRLMQRPAAKRKEEGETRRRVAENAHAVLASHHMVDEVARYVTNRTGVVLSKKKK